MQAFSYRSVNDFTRIMCWVHVHRKIEERSRSIDEASRQEIRDDIDALQLLYTPELFDYGYGLFCVKWSKKKNSEVQTFLDYFKSEWILSNLKERL